MGRGDGVRHEGDMHVSTRIYVQLQYIIRSDRARPSFGADLLYGFEASGGAITTDNLGRFWFNPRHTVFSSSAVNGSLLGKNYTWLQTNASLSTSLSPEIYGILSIEVCTINK